MIFSGMYNGTNTEGYGSTLQGRSSSGYSPYGATSQASHLQPKDMVRERVNDSRELNMGLLGLLF